MITHVVLLRLRKTVPKAEIDRVFDRLAALKQRIPGLITFSGGAYSSPEGLHQGYTHGFVMTFADAAARDAYLPHPEHEKVKKLVLDVLDGGLDGVVAFDFES
ncbi:MAG: Dabb family protein [Planctomycetota bacterium]